MKGQMKGKRFAAVSKMKKKTLAASYNIKTDDFQIYFQQWGKTLIQVYRVKRRLI